MAASTIYTHFHFKANRLRDLQNITKDKPIRVEVVKVVELTEKQFRHFSTHLLEDMPFITPELEHRKSGYVERKRRPYQGNVVRIA